MRSVNTYFARRDVCIQRIENGSFEDYLRRLVVSWIPVVYKDKNVQRDLRAHFIVIIFNQ